MIRGVCAAVLAAAMLNVPAKAQNAAFQDFFFDVCRSPTGALAVRCAETQDAAGNLSGDSESSLNPSQGLSANDVSLNAARGAARQTREQSERLREEMAAPDISPGTFNLLFHLRGTDLTSRRVRDVDNERRFDASSTGVEIGFDYRLSETTVLAALLGYEDSGLDFDPRPPGVNFFPGDNSGTVDTRATTLTLLGLSWLPGDVALEGVAGIGRFDYDIQRNAVFQESRRQLPQTITTTRASPSGEGYWFGGGISRTWQADAWTLAPYVNGNWSRTRVESYAESDISGAGLAMAFDSLSRDSLRTTAGVLVTRVIGTRFGVLQPQFRLELEREFARDPQSLGTRFLLDAGANQYSVRHDNPDDLYGNAAFSLTAILPQGWMGFADIDALLWNDDYRGWRATVGLRRELW